ncbi:MAG TPA: flagellar biosynthetic protein FliO [Terriglobales bacterium]|jgi:flagellar biogenesis protein FliO
MNIEEISKSAAFRRDRMSGMRDSLWRRSLLWWKRLVEAGKRPPKSLRLCESLSLGERRMVAVIAYQDSRFLVGGTSGSLVLLANLGKDTGTETKPTDDLPLDSSRGLPR